MTECFTTDANLATLLHELLLEIGMPADLACQMPTQELSEPLRKLGANSVGHRQRILTLLRKEALLSAATAPVAFSSHNDTAAAAAAVKAEAEVKIPRRLFTFWHNDPFVPRARASADQELVRTCIALMKRQHPGWEFRVLSPSCSDLPPPPVADPTSLTGAQMADWYRLCALALHGGVYLDATCITLKPVEDWVDLTLEAIQGFTLVSDLDTMESWAIAAPRGSAFMSQWRDAFGSALQLGTREYCSSLPASVISTRLRPSLPYLTIHAAWRAVRASLPQPCAFRLLSPVESGRPYRYLAEASWDSPKAVRQLFAKSEDELAHSCGPLIKLRGRERDSVQPLTTYGRSSALARTLLAATVPTTVVERMAFLRLGLDPDSPHRTPLE